MESRKSEVIINYEGIDISKDLAPYLSDFSFSDNKGKSDDIQISLQDKDKTWQGPWLPTKGDIIVASIKTHNWNGVGEKEELPCGKFYIDNVGLKGPPDSIVIKAMSVPFSTNGKDTKHNRSWENASLATIASEVAESSGLELLYSAPNFHYDRVDQTKQTDLAFITKLASKEAIAVKVTNDTLVLYAEKEFEDKAPILTLERGKSDLLGYDFDLNAAEECYKYVKVSYFEPDKKTAITYTYTVPGVDKGPTLTLNKRAMNVKEAIRLARSAARNHNKGAKVGKLTIVGNVNCVQGITVRVANFEAFDGKYFVESSSHKISSGSGYTTDLSIREVLGY